MSTSRYDFSGPACAGKHCRHEDHAVGEDPAGMDALCPHGIPLGAEVEPCSDCLRAARDVHTPEVVR